MATIEKRAIKSVPELIKINGNYAECWRNGNIRGVTEQEAITKQEIIDKAYEVHCSLCCAYVACKRRGVFYCPEIEIMRKALEL